MNLSVLTLRHLPEPIKTGTLEFSKRLTDGQVVADTIGVIAARPVDIWING
jgi:3D (Asp-Asp-Asp) domain-containing protein